MPYSTRRRTGRPSFGTARTSFKSRSFSGRSSTSSSGRRGPKKDYIDPKRFIQAARPVEQVEYTPTHQFEDFAVNDTIKANLRSKGFVTPSPIQDKTIPHVLDSRDVIGIANTGTGKTAAFAVPLLHRLMSAKGSKALIVAPTRELAQQIYDECKSIGRGSGLAGAMLIGGSPMSPQLRDLRDNPPIVIGTPGRIKDHLERGTLKLERFNHVVLDEVDRMLDMGFINDVSLILGRLASERQSLFFSATMDRKVSELIQSFSNDPITISVKQGETSENVEQNIVQYEAQGQKIDKLHDILLRDEVKKVIIFDDTQRSVERLSGELVARGFEADAIHGGKTQGQRQRALNKFKKSDVTVLVATDVAARGIDVADITHVINYSTPQSYQDYVHRIGRAGRAGRVGYALTFVGR
jgi:ATP-dependent RNA helicase RhlE